MTKFMHVGHFIIATGSTADVVVTGMGFEPTGLLTRSYRTDNDEQHQDGVANASQDSCRITDIGTGNMSVYIDPTLLIAGGAIEAVLKSFDSDGFTIDVQINNTGLDTAIQFLAFRSA